MAASQTSIALRNSTNAEFRATGSFINAGLTAGGWTKMDSDIDWTTVAAPALNTYAGYEVWRSPAEGGLTTFYLKLRFGSSNNAAPAFALAYSVSWSYSGSGSTLGGTPTTEVSSLSDGVAASATARFCTIAVGTGYIALNLGNGVGTTGAFLLCISRTRDTSLNHQDELLLVSQRNLSNAFTSNVKTYQADSSEVTSTVAAAAEGWPYCPPPTTVALGAVIKGNVILGFIQGFGLRRTSPCEQYLGCFAGAVGSVQQTVTIPIYGVDHTFIILGSTSTAPGTFLGSTTYNGLILYE